MATSAAWVGTGDVGREAFAIPPATASVVCKDTNIIVKRLAPQSTENPIELVQQKDITLCRHGYN